MKVADFPITPERIYNLSRQIVNNVIPENSGGFTINPSTAQSPTFDENTYILSLKGYEQRFMGYPDISQIMNWLNLHYTLLLPNHYIGGWRKGSIFFLDISIPVDGFDEAMQTARENEQFTIYHPFSKRSIKVKALQIEIKLSGES